VKPTANAGADRTVAIPYAGANTADTVELTLDGSSSSDPEDTATLTYQWAEGGTVLGSGKTFQVDAPVGVHVYTLTVTDIDGGTAKDTVRIRVFGLPIMAVNGQTIAVNADNYDLRGVAAWGALVKVYRDVDGDGVKESGDPLVGQQQLGEGTGAFTVTVTLRQNATNKLLVTTTIDPVTTDAVPGPTVIEDSKAPARAVFTSPASATKVTTTTFNLIGTAEAGATVTIYRDLDRDGKLDPDELKVLAKKTATGGAFSASVALTTGANRFIATTTDAAGNSAGVTYTPIITRSAR
jgi:hypothetical protein